MEFDFSGFWLRVQFFSGLNHMIAPPPHLAPSQNCPWHLQKIDKRPLRKWSWWGAEFEKERQVETQRDPHRNRSHTRTKKIHKNFFVIMIWKRESYEDNIIPPPLRRYIKCRLVLNYQVEVIYTAQGSRRETFN